MRREYEGSSQMRRFRQGKLRLEDRNPGFRPAKLRSQRGESLVEVLASVLIGVLAVGLLASAIAVSSQIDRSAEKKDESFYEELSAAEAQKAPEAAGTVSVTPSGGSPVTYQVDYYGGDDIYSYKLQTGGGSP